VLLHLLLYLLFYLLQVQGQIWVEMWAFLKTLEVKLEGYRWGKTDKGHRRDRHRFQSMSSSSLFVTALIMPFPNGK
jgi:hypothetical protein